MSGGTVWSRITLLLLLVAAGAGVAAADNYTRDLHGTGTTTTTTKHEPRFITFNTQENGHVEVDLEFAVPFITIPVKKTVDNAWGLLNGENFANINVGALLVAGGMVAGAVVVVPLLSSLFTKSVLFTGGGTYRGIKREGEEESELWRIMTFVDNALIEHNVDTTACMQRTVCWLVKSARRKLEGGEASSQDKIIDGLATSPWLNNLIQGSAVQNAITNGLHDDKCSAIYSTCKLNAKSFQRFVKKIRNTFEMY